MTALERDLHLQELILQGDTKRIREFYDEKPIDRPLSRALGYACRYSTPEIVRMLIDGGATFQYNRHSVMVKTNGIAGRQLVDDIAESILYLLDADDCRTVQINTLRYTDRKHERTRGEAYDETVRILAASAAETDFNLSGFLFFAVLYDNADAQRALRKAGVTQLTGYVRRLIADEPIAKGISRYSPYIDELDSELTERSSDLKYLERVLQNLNAIAGGPVRMRDIPWYWKGSRQLGPEGATHQLLKYTTLSKHYGKRKVLEECVRRDYVTILNWALDQGWARAWRDYEHLKKVALEAGAAEEVTALLLEKQHASGTKKPKQRSTNPFAAENLRRLWSTKTCEDGSLQIVSYKCGDDPDAGYVVVPDHIGTRTVTKLNAEAFSPRFAMSDKIRQARENIRELMLPGTIEEIPERLLRNHRKLEKVVIAEGVTSIGDGAFAGCDELREVTLPHSLRSIGEEAFSQCRKLQRVEIAETTKLAQRAFQVCPRLMGNDGLIRVGGRIASVSIPNMPRVLAIAEEPAVYKPFGFQLPMLTYQKTTDAPREKPDLPSDLRVGDDIVFGRFPYDTDFAMKPLHWTCVAREEDAALCITRDVIALIYAHWEKEDAWNTIVSDRMNYDMLRIMFSAAERKRLLAEGIADSMGRKLFLLSEEELHAYVPVELRGGAATPHAAQQKGPSASRYNAPLGSWILRDAGKKHTMKAVSAADGCVQQVHPTDLYGAWGRGEDARQENMNRCGRVLGLRPAMHLQLG